MNPDRKIDAEKMHMLSVKTLKGNIDSATHEIVFKVENMDDFIDQAEKPEDTVMDYMLMATLVGIAYSTVRGIIFTRTQGTSLNTVILPVVDPKKIIRPDEVNENKPVQEQNTADTLN